VATVAPLQICLYASGAMGHLEFCLQSQINHIYLAGGCAKFGAEVLLLIEFYMSAYRRNMEAGDV
jgi:hypothetical protein